MAAMRVRRRVDQRVHQKAGQTVLQKVGQMAAWTARLWAGLRVLQWAHKKVHL